MLIRESKFKKSRLLPLHDTTWVVLDGDLDRRRRVAGHVPCLFVSRRSGPLSHTVVVETFHDVLRAVGLPVSQAMPVQGSWISAAVRGLQACPEDCRQVGRHMLALTTYMGHAKVESTTGTWQARPSCWPISRSAARRLHMEVSHDTHRTAYQPVFASTLTAPTGASPHTCVSYAYSFQLLFEFASQRCSVTPSERSLEQIDAPSVMDFLAALESERGNSPTTRHARLAAINSFIHVMEDRVPALLEQIRRVLAIPAKKTDQPLIQRLSVTEMQALLNVSDLQTRAGIRDRAMLHVGFAAGLRVSELLTLPLTALIWQPTPTIHIQGQGWRQPALPLWPQTAEDVRAWLAVRRAVAAPELFISTHGRAMTRVGFAYLLRKYVQRAAQDCPSLQGKHVSPHVLRHTCAMMIDRATGNLRKVSLWLDHADMPAAEVYSRSPLHNYGRSISAIMESFP